MTSPEEKEQLAAKRSKPKRRGNIDPLSYSDVDLNLDDDEEQIEDN